MSGTGAGGIHGELDGIALDAQGLQEVSDTQASIMHSLASTMESLVPAMEGLGGTAMQNIGAQLHEQGMRFSTTFAEHSQMMHNNGTIFSTRDEDGANVIQQVSNLIV